MSQAESIPMRRCIEKSLLIVNAEHPLETLPFICDALICMGTFFQQEPELSHTDRAEIGVGLMLDFLAYAIEDVHDALQEHGKQT